MIIEVDGFYEHAYLTGKSCSLMELRNMYRVTKVQCTSSKEFTDVFCRLFQFERVSSSRQEGIRIDFVIDTDTDRIYVPRH